MTERTVDLWDHLPPFLKDYEEFDALITAEEPEFQNLVGNQIDLLNNLFILTADSVGLKRFEKILNMYPGTSETLDTRREKVLSRWFANDTFKLDMLYSRLVTLQGNDDVDIYWDEDDCYFLHIIISLDSVDKIRSADAIIEQMLPANIAYRADNMEPVSGTINTRTGTGTKSTVKIYQEG